MTRRQLAPARRRASLRTLALVATAALLAAAGRIAAAAPLLPSRDPAPQPPPSAEPAATPFLPHGTPEVSKGPPVPPSPIAPAPVRTDELAATRESALLPAEQQLRPPDRTVPPEAPPPSAPVLRLHPRAPRPTTARRPAAVRTRVPRLHPSNRILQAGCRYLPVPYNLPPGARDSPNSVFNIEIVTCVPNPALNAAIVRAARRWMSIIVGDLPAMTTEDYAEIDDCLQDAFGNPIASCGYVDDILISFELSPVDGPGGTLAYSGPLYTRDPALPGKQLPLSGFIALDIADWQQMLQEGTLQPVLEHEMAHVLGFGTLWKDKNLIRPLDCEAHAAAGDLQSASYAGRAARSSMVRIGFDAATPPPVESQGGIGRACGHWREASMYTELMTGLISPAGTRNPLSMLTALSFRDMGYAVDERSGGIDMFSRRAGRARSGMVQRPVGDCLGKFRGAKKARRRDGQA